MLSFSQRVKILIPMFYSSAVRNIFPKVERLDGMDLPKPILFEVEDDLNLPLTQPSFFWSDPVKEIVVQFIQQYFQVLESGDRALLGAAYTEDALFSLAAHFPENSMSGNKYTKWIELENRNLKRVTNMDKRHKLLYKGRGDIVNFLMRFPKVIHDPNSFVIDIPLAKSCLMHVVLTGVFKQPVDKGPHQSTAPVRNFMKSLIVVPVGSGFCISNEELYLNTATVEQVRRAFKDPSPTSGVPIAGSGAGIVLAPNQDPMAGIEPAQFEMIKQFVINSKMLPQYCRLCLEENNWDFAKAGETFLKLQKENKIPPEYFRTVVS